MDASRLASRVPARLRATQERALVTYLDRQVRPYSALFGPVLEATPVRSRDDLALVPCASIEDLNGADLVLRPTPERILASGDRRLAWRMRRAMASGRRRRFERTCVERPFKPVSWLWDHGHAVGYSEDDLERLGELGAALLGLAGVGPSDVLVGIVPPGPNLAYWELTMGARQAGVSALFLPPDTPPADIARLGATAIAGRSGDLLRLFDALSRDALATPSLRTVLAVGDRLDPARRSRISQLAHRGRPDDVDVVWAWAPPYVRSLWTECRGGDELHTAPGSELVELIDPLSGTPVPPGSDGEVVWTPIGWKGTVAIRLRTGVFAHLDDGPCFRCGRAGARLRPVSTLPPFARVLDEHDSIDAWQAELRSVDGSEELIVYIAPKGRAHPGPLLRELDKQLSVTQFVVLPRREVEARLQAAGDERVVDNRH